MTKPCNANEFYLCAQCRLPLGTHRKAERGTVAVIGPYTVQCAAPYSLKIFTHKNLFEDLGAQPFNSNLRLFPAGHEAAPFGPQEGRFQLRQFWLRRVTWCHQRSHNPTRSSRACAGRETQS